MWLKGVGNDVEDGTVRRPRLLDLCCKAGGCSVGYYRAGFDVVGVDIEPQPNYPFTFYQADAMTFPLNDFDVVHASPPCQRYSQATTFHGTQENHPDLIEPMRQRLQAWGGPWVMENIERAPLVKPIKLCGNMFGLRVYRHRLFESNISLQQPRHVKHVLKAAGPGAIAKTGEYWSVGGHFGHKEEAAVAMGIGWMKTVEELANAIPPVYTEWVGLQLLQALGQKRREIRVQLCECGCGEIAKTPVRGGRPGRFYFVACRNRVHRAKRASVTKLSGV